MSLERTLSLNTEAAGFVIYHPDDLIHTRRWPAGWYAEPFVYSAESAAGRVLSWCTGADGAFEIRCTTSGLTPRERRYARAEWTFPLRVIHGRVYHDSAINGPEDSIRQDRQGKPEQWIAVDNGDYAVTVTAIEWDAEPGAENPGFDSLSNNVLTFKAAANIASMKPARAPPVIDHCRPPAYDVVPPYGRPSRPPR